MRASSSRAYPSGCSDRPSGTSSRIRGVAAAGSGAAPDNPTPAALGEGPLRSRRTRVRFPPPPRLPDLYSRRSGGFRSRRSRPQDKDRRQRFEERGRWHARYRAGERARSVAAHGRGPPREPGIDEGCRREARGVGGQGRRGGGPGSWASTAQAHWSDWAPHPREVGQLQHPFGRLSAFDDPDDRLAWGAPVGGERFGRFGQSPY